MLVVLCLFTVSLVLFYQFRVSKSASSVKQQKALKHRTDFDWLKDANYVRLYVTEKDTHLSMPKQLSSIDGRDLIACFVKSSPHSFVERFAIRETWGKVLKPLFVLGKSDANTMRMALEEAAKFNDMIVEDFTDSYMNLTIKSAFAMKYFLDYFHDTDYFMSMDEDTYVNPANLFKMIGTAPKNSLIGRLETDLKPDRDVSSKYFIPGFLFNDTKLPPYLSGQAYLIPGR